MNKMTECGISVKHTSAYFPQGNMTERYNREIGRLLRAYCREQHTKWPNTIAWVEQCLNSVVNEATGFTPSFLQFGQVERNPFERLVRYPNHEKLHDDNLEQYWILARESLRTKTERRIARHDGKVNLIVFKPGDEVLVRTHPQSSAEDRIIRKFVLLYEDPYRILQASGNSYVIGDLEGNERGRQNVRNLRPYQRLTE
nr:unnamed protein product [Callosobruchus analis]